MEGRRIQRAIESATHLAELLHELVLRDSGELVDTEGEMTIVVRLNCS